MRKLEDSWSCKKVEPTGSDMYTSSGDFLFLGGRGSCDGAVVDGLT